MIPSPGAREYLHWRQTIIECSKWNKIYSVMDSDGWGDGCIDGNDGRWSEKYFLFCRFLSWPGFLISNPEFHHLKPITPSVFIILIQFFNTVFNIYITSYINFFMFIHLFVMKLFLFKYRNPSVQIKISRPLLIFPVLIFQNHLWNQTPKLISPPLLFVFAWNLNFNNNILQSTLEKIISSIF